MFVYPSLHPDTWFQNQPSEPATLGGAKREDKAPFHPKRSIIVNSGKIKFHGIVLCHDELKKS